MSTTTTSPLSITRSDTSWCGLAPFGPGADDDERGRGVALLDDRRGDVRADLRLGAARLEELAHAGVHAVDRRARGAQLRPPRRRPCASAARVRIGPARVCAASGRASRSPNTCSRGHRVGHREPGRAAGEVADQQVRVFAVVPGDDLDAEVVQRQAAQPGASRRGTTSAGGARCPAAGSTRQVEPLVARAVGVEEVAQVGARGDQQQVDAVVGGDVARPADAVGEQRGGNGRSREARSHVPQYAPPPCVIPATRPPVGDRGRRSHGGHAEPHHRDPPSHPRCIGPAHPAQHAAAVAVVVRRTCVGGSRALLNRRARDGGTTGRHTGTLRDRGPPADAAGRRQPVLPRLLRRPGVDHGAGRHAGQRRARVQRHGRRGWSRSVARRGWWRAWTWTGGPRSG